MNGRGTATPYFAIKYNEKMATVDRNQRQNEHARNWSNKVQSQPRERVQSLDVQSYPRRFRHERETSLRESYEPCRPERQPVALASRKGSNFQVDKSVPRVPIELHEEQASAAEQRVKGRVIYRNNIPKNSYYLLSNMQQLAPQARKPKNYSQNEVEFNSKFQSGNLSSVVRAAKNEYYAFMREDTNTHGLRQWFYFQVRCNRPMRVLFRVYKFAKRCLLYREGMRPYIRAESGDWRQNGEDISYCYDEELKCFYLSFSYAFTAEGESIEVANMPPYTYSKLLRFLQQLRPHQNVRVENIGQSLGGVQIPSIQITRATSQSNNETTRKCIVMLGRTHPSQTCSNFTIESIVSKLLASQLLLGAYDFFIVPMVNPDGVIVGNHRTGLLGNDLNRRFTGNLHKQLFPEVEAVKSLVKRLQAIYKVQFLFDFHGHSAKSNIFAYAEEEAIGSDKYLKSRIIPKLLGRNFAAFRYSYCVFDQVREKKNTARVYFRNKSSINAITFQQSYGLVDKSLISIQDWNNFGIAFVDALEQYTSHFLADQSALAEFLSEQIAIDQKNKQERMRRERRASRSIEIQKKKTTLEQPQDKSAVFKQKEVHTTSDVAEQDQLDSGDEQLQATDQELDFIQRNMIFRRRQSKQRDLFEMSDMSIELQHSGSPQKQQSILHEQKMPLVSRIMRMKEKHKASRDLIDILTSRHLSQRQQLKDSLRNVGLKLPSIPRYAG